MSRTRDIEHPFIVMPMKRNADGRRAGEGWDAMGCNDGLPTARAMFGDTDRAGGVPDCIAPSAGPVYLEGRLVLSLSFRGGPKDMQAKDAGELIERYRLWDDLAGAWHDCDLEVLRFEQADVVVRAGLDPAILWSGALDTRARVMPVPDLDGEGMAANGACDLRWKVV